MFRFFAIGILGVVGLLVPSIQVSAAGSQTHQHVVDWNQRDTAIYVVSTLNVVHTRKGAPVVGLLTKRLGIVRYEVWDDINNGDLYFILLKKSDGSSAGILAYQMGWPQPLTVTRPLGRLGIRSAPTAVADAFRSDPKQLIGSFTSTLPR